MGRPADDPYRTLGILRGADPDEVRSAHRRLAKRFHPDGSMGDEQRFLAVQEAYQLLSDPLRRREWDRRHTPGPMPAGQPAGRWARPGSAEGRPADERATRDSDRHPRSPADGPSRTTAACPWRAHHDVVGGARSLVAGFQPARAS